MAASLIERLPDEGDPQRSREETIAKNVAFVTYAGTCVVHSQFWTSRSLLYRPRGVYQVAPIL